MVKVRVVPIPTEFALVEFGIASRIADDERGASGLEDDGIPEGWQLARLPDVARINMGQSPPGITYNQSGKGMPFFQGKSDFGATHPKVRVWCTAPTKVAAPGDILISVRAPVGPTNLADQHCAIGRGLAAISPESGVPSLFLLYYLRYREEELASQGTGTTFVAINRTHLDQLAIPVPPIAEQQRIAEMVEALRSRIDAARARLDRTQTVVKRFRQAVLAAACSGKLTEDWRKQIPVVEPAASSLARLERRGATKLRRGIPDTVEPPDFVTGVELPETWALASTAHLLRTGALVDVKDGNHGANHPKISDFSPGGLPFITAAQVRDYRIDYGGAPTVSGKPLEKLRVGFSEPGDAVLTHKGSVGRAALNTEPCGARVR